MEQATIRIVRSEVKRAVIAGMGVLAFAIVLVLCNPLPYPLSTDPDAARHQLGKLVPVGTRLSDAEARMRELGWKCEIEKNRPFSDERKPPGEYQKYEGISFLSCSMTKSGFVGFPQRLWVVAFPFDHDQKITNAFVQHWNRSLVMP